MSAAPKTLTPELALDIEPPRMPECWIASGLHNFGYYRYKAFNDRTDAEKCAAEMRCTGVWSYIKIWRVEFPA